MLLALHNYIQLLSLASILIGLIGVQEEYRILTKYGVLTYLLSILTLIFSRNVNIFITAYIAQLVLKPLSIFCFLILIKTIWNLAIDSINKYSIKSPI
jgi:hypothetical protein